MTYLLLEVCAIQVSVRAKKGSELSFCTKGIFIRFQEENVEFGIADLEAFGNIVGFKAF